MTEPPIVETRFSRFVLPGLVLLTVVFVHLMRSPYGEPWKNNDETRHVMTGVFFRDAIHDAPASLRDPKGYAERYYTQYPALGLIVWPPFFYVVEGAVMAVLGTDYAVARGVLTGFALLATFHFLRFAKKMLGGAETSLALAVFLLGYLMLDLSRHVLLELPTLALVLGSIVHFEAYLTQGKRRDALLVCGFAAAAALTRFDGVVLLPYFGLRLVMLRRFSVLLHGSVLIGIAGAALATVPYYAFTWLHYGQGLSTAATQGTIQESSGFLALRNFIDYPLFVRWQVGFAAVFFGIIGAVVPGGFRRFGPAYALFAATYVAFVPLAEPEMRHAVYWLPAVAVFAARGAMVFWQRFGRTVGTIGVVALVGGTTLQAVWDPGWTVRGYEDAAIHVLTKRETDRPVLMDGVLNGGFIYQIRRHDPERKVQVLRGDKLFYAMLSDPRSGYTQFAADEAELLKLLHDADPEWIVLEQPQLFYMHLHGATLLRETIAKYPERFRLEYVVRIGGNHDEFTTGRLELYRKLDRNPHPIAPSAVPVLGLGRAIGSPTSE